MKDYIMPLNEDLYIKSVLAFTPLSYENPSEQNIINGLYFDLVNMRDYCTLKYLYNRFFYGIMYNTNYKFQ